jgi:hypothetical protein
LRRTIVPVRHRGRRTARSVRPVARHGVMRSIVRTKNQLPRGVAFSKSGCSACALQLK